MAGQILGQAVDNDVSAQIERARHHRSGEGIVYQDSCLAGFRQLRNAGNVWDAEQWVGDGLHDDTTGARFGNRLLDG